MPGLKSRQLGYNDNLTGTYLFGPWPLCLGAFLLLTLPAVSKYLRLCSSAPDGHTTILQWAHPRQGCLPLRKSEGIRGNERRVALTGDLRVEIVIEILESDSMAISAYTLALSHPAGETSSSRLMDLARRPLGSIPYPSPWRD
jgi:hypothetical protein